MTPPSYLGCRDPVGGLLLHVLRVYSRPVPATGKATAGTLPLSSKVLCVLYAGIAVAALVATWSRNVAYLHAGIGRFLIDFVDGLKVTPASRSITCDILFFFLAAAVLMVIEARKYGVRFVWLYILAGATIAICSGPYARPNLRDTTSKWIHTSFILNSASHVRERPCGRRPAWVTPSGSAAG